MSTLIAVYNAEGRCISRCDARCHDARQETCRCICGGELHGRGERAGRERVLEASGIDLSSWAAERGISSRYLSVQMSLPTS